MRRIMEVNNVSIDDRDEDNRNYFLEQVGEPYPDMVLPKEIRDEVIPLECNKRTNITCLNALEIDILSVTR